MGGELEILEDTPGWRVGLYRNVLLMHWRENISVEGLAACDRAGRSSRYRLHPGAEGVRQADQQEYPITRAYMDARVAKIFAGTQRS